MDEKEPPQMRRLSGFGKLALDQLSGILSDHQLFVGGDDPNLNLGVVGGDLDLSAALLVHFGIDLDAQVAQVCADICTDAAVVLADASGEGQDVDAVQGEPPALICCPSRVTILTV